MSNLKYLYICVAILLLTSCGSDDPIDENIDILVNNISEDFVIEMDVEEETLLSEETEEIGGENWICTNKELSITKTPSFFPLFDPASDAIYPGSALQGRSIQSFPPDKIPVKRSGGSVVINNLTGTSASSVTMNEVSLVNVTNGINQIISAQSDSFPARTFISINQVKSKESLALALSANASFFSIFSAKASFDLNTRANRRNFLVEINQAFYTMSFERPSRPSEFFHPDVTTEDLANFVGDGNPPVYVSSVTYGRIFYLLVSSTEKESDLASSLSASFFFGGFDGTVKHISQVNGLTVQALALGGNKNDATQAVSAGIQGLDAFLNTLEQGAQIGQAVPLSYTIRSVKSDQVVRQGILTSFETRECRPLSERIQFNESIVNFGTICRGSRKQKQLIISNLDDSPVPISMRYLDPKGNELPTPLGKFFIVDFEGSGVIQPMQDLTINIEFGQCIGFLCPIEQSNLLEFSYTIKNSMNVISIPVKGVSDINPNCID